MATVRKRTWKNAKGEQKKAWIVTYTKDGKRRSGGAFERKKDADARRRKLEDEIERGIHIPNRETVTLAYARDQYLRWLERQMKAGCVAGNTHRTYRQQAIFPDKLCSLRLSQIKPSMLNDWLDELIGVQKLRRNSVERRLCVLRQIFKFAARQDPPWIALNPLADQQVTLGRRGGRKEQVLIPTKDEMRRIFIALADRGKFRNQLPHNNMVLIVTLAALTGMRIGEICGLQWECINWATGEIDVRYSLSRYDGLKSTKTKASDRKIIMVPTVRAALEQHAANWGSEMKGFVLRSRPEGGSYRCQKFEGKFNCVIPNQVSTYPWPRLLREAGIVDEAGAKKYTFHALRHFFVSMLIEHGLQPFHTSKMVGHSRVTMTLDTYGHLFPSDTSSKLAIEAVASQFFSTAPSVAPVPLITTRAIPVSEALEPDRERMRQLHAEGKSIREISEIMGYPTSTIGYWINPRVRVMALANAEQQRQKRRDAAQRSRDAAKSPDAAQVQHEPVKTLS